MKKAISIVIEGPWGSGKTELAEMLCKVIPGSIFLPEPDHKNDQTGFKSIEEWYWNSFVSLEKEASAIIAKGNTVILERNKISLLAYAHSVGKGKLFGDARFRENYLTPDYLIILKPSQSISKKKIESVDIKDLYQDPNKVSALYFNFLVKNQEMVMAKEVLVGDLDEMISRIKQIVEIV